MRTDSSPAVERMVVKSEVEFGIMVNFSDHPNHPSLKYLPFREERFVSFSSPMHPLAKKAKVTLAELCQAPCVIMKPKHTNVNRIETLIKQITKQSHLTSVTYTETADTFKALVKNGVGFGIFYRDYLASDFKEGSLKILNVPELALSYPSFIISRQEEPLSPKARAFIAFLRQCSQKKLKTKRKSS